MIIIRTDGVTNPTVAIIPPKIPPALNPAYVAHVLNKFKESQVVQSVFYALRPAVTGLIAVAGFAVFKISVLSLDRFVQTKSFLRKKGVSNPFRSNPSTL